MSASGHQSNTPGRELDWDAIGAELSKKQGRAYWRSLEQLSAAPGFQSMLHREFPVGASEWPEDVSRRGFLKFAAAAFALAGLTACTKQPVRQIFPYVFQPAELVPGEPLFYATSVLHGGFANGAIAKSREGHPVKLDGNPDHPATLGGSDVWLQTAILDLYDPDRSQTVLHQGELSNWAHCLADLNNVVAEEQGRGGAGLRFLTETVTSPTLAAQLRKLLQLFPQAKWHQYEPIFRDNVLRGSKVAFGEPVATQHHFDKARIVVSLESDFFSTHPLRLRYSRQFTDGRRISSGQREMNRLYVVESSPSITGTMADRRLALNAGKVEAFAEQLAAALGIKPGSATAVPTLSVPWWSQLLNDLEQNHGASIVIAGEGQPASVHALVHLINERLGNVGKTVVYTECAEANPGEHLPSLRELCQDLQAGKVETLFVLGWNPIFSAPADLPLAELSARAKRTVHLGLELDETAARCTWHVPGAHFLEAWGDARSFDGTVCLVQPLIQPLYGGKSACELLGALTQQQPVLSDYDIVRAYWQSQNKWPDFEQGWRESLHNGFIADTAFAPKEVKLREWEQIQSDLSKPSASGVSELLNGAGPPGGTARANANPATALFGFNFGSERAQKPGDVVPIASGLELCFRPDASVWDGRFANNGWLQECPRPVTKLTWDNAALVSAALAQRCHLRQNELIDLEVRGRRLRLPVWITPGQADSTITVHLGYGRSRVGRVGAGVGFDAYPLRTSHEPWIVQDVRLFKTGAEHLLVSTQVHHNVESPDRQVLRDCTLQEWLADPKRIGESTEQPGREETLYNPDEYRYDGYKWGMSIDLSTCIGCNSCLVACQAENNIPFVGKDQIRRHRDLFWIRIDTYYKGTLEEPGFAHMPVPCMHCEHAPCELVCPVEATLHDSEGLNLQVYNRCVGTRFCSNNCPYKVRRFNFLQYTNYHQPSYRPMYNPEVTVRWRGVMEKCTYCIQRISAARINAEKENRRIRDGEVRTACQEACPTSAIIFGDLNLPESQVSKLKKLSLDYSMLGQLNTRPRTTYLAKVENPGAG